MYIITRYCHKQINDDYCENLFYYRLLFNNSTVIIHSFNYINNRHFEYFTLKITLITFSLQNQLIKCINFYSQRVKHYTINLNLFYYIILI